jgi:hypothetical protein
VTHVFDRGRGRPRAKANRGITSDLPADDDVVLVAAQQVRVLPGLLDGDLDEGGR